MRGEKSAATTRCPPRASGMANDPAPHPISSTDSPGRICASSKNACAYGCVSRGRKCLALASQYEGSSAGRRCRCSSIHSSFQSVSNSRDRIAPPLKTRGACHRAPNSIPRKNRTHATTAVPPRRTLPGAADLRGRCCSSGEHSQGPPRVPHAKESPVGSPSCAGLFERRTLTVLPAVERKPSSSASWAAPGSVRRGGRTRCRRGGSPA